LRIVLIVEGKTETVFLPPLRRFLDARLTGGSPKIIVNRHDGRIPTGGKLKRIVQRHLEEGANAVIALTDVYTGTR